MYYEVLRFIPCSYDLFFPVPMPMIKAPSSAASAVELGAFFLFKFFTFFLQSWPASAIDRAPAVYIRWRPYRSEYTGSLPNSEVNRSRARSVLDWGTVREHLRVLPAFYIKSSQPDLMSSGRSLALIDHRSHFGSR